MSGAPHLSQDKGKGRDFLAHAEGYGGKLGFRVIPLRPGKKIPLIPNWQNEGTWDVAKIREWWRKWPNANIGILTGRYRDGYFCVIDFDPRNGGGWWDDVGEDVLPDTWVVHTPSGGRHFYYKTTELVRCEKLPSGVDLRGEGGLVVVPPSVFFDDKGKYVGDWVFQIGNMPKDVGMAIRTPRDLDKVREAAAAGIVLVGDRSGGQSGGQSGGGAASGRSLWLMPPPIPKGMRHDYLVSLAGALHSAGLSERELEAVLWAALELLETREDFDPVREVDGILKGLQKWEGATYTLGSLLRIAPERTAAVLRRVLTGGAVNGEPVSEPVSAPVSVPVSEPVSAPTERAGGADSGQVASGADGQNGGQDAGRQAADTGQSDGEKERGEGDADTMGRRFLVAEIMSKLEVRKGADGTFRYVYRAADGTELEAAWAPEGVRDLLAKLGLKTPLKEVKRLLGIMQGGGADAGESEAKEKKGRKSKTADKDDIKAILWRHKWVVWRGALWLVATPKLLKVDLDLIHGLLKQEGVDVGKETLKSYLADILTDLPKDPLEGLVVTPSPIYGKVGNLRGLWFSHRGDLHLVTPTERRVFSRGQWPDGVYARDTGMQAVLPDWEGEPIHLLKYWEGITPRFEGNPKVALAMFLPVLFGQGDIGLILRGPAKSGKSTLLRAMAYLHLGRKPNTPSGSVNMRDIIAVLQRRQIAFFDEVNTFSIELQETLKRMITHDGAVMRALYTDFETVETELSGSAIFCTTNLEKLASDLRTRCFVWDLREKKGGLYETQILEFCALLWRKALAGAIKLYQQAAKLKPPPKGLLPQVRFRDWLSWAYRYAVVLGVADEFVAYVAKSKRAAHRGDKYEFLLDAILHPDFDPNKEYTISDLLSLTSLPASDAKRIKSSINRDGVRSDMIALALDAGYNLRIEKGWDVKDRKERYKFLFSPIEVSTSDHLREILESLGIKPDLTPDWEGDWDGDVAPPAEPLPQNPHAPMPEVHTPPPVPEKALLELPRSLSEVKQAVQKAAPAPEPAPVAPQSVPAEVGGGAPMAPLTPDEALAIALQAARPPDPSLPTPGKNERGVGVLREALARLPKPGGILQQRGTPIEGAPHVPLPPELPEYLRAMAGTFAAEAVKAAEKGRFAEARAFWASAVKYLGHLAFFAPTREAVAAALLARAAECACLAAQGPPEMSGAAVLFAKLAGAVFFGKAAPDGLLRVLLEAPLPTEYDPCLAPHYRAAAGYLVAAHWVLTGGDLKLLNGWGLPMRWKRDEAEALLLFSLGSEKKSVACAHLYLGDLPF